MKFFHFIRAAPFEFSLYGFAAVMIVALVGGLVVHYYAYEGGVSALRHLSGFVVALAYVLGMPLSVIGAGLAPCILLIRRIVWRKRQAFCIYEFILHLIIALPLAAAASYLFISMTMAA